jgi:PilZ domain
LVLRKIARLRRYARVRRFPTGGIVVDERRVSLRQKSFLQGRIYFNNRRSSIDCLVRDYSETGARLKLSETATVPEAMELYIPNREAMHRARVEWRSGDEMGVSFGDEMRAPSIAPDVVPGSGDLAARVQRLESEVAALRRVVNELRTESRKHRGEA